MNNLPDYLSWAFILTSALTVFLFLMASRYSKKVLLIIFTWMVFHGILGYSEFYQNTETIPPRIFLTFGPTILLFLFLLVTKTGNRWIEKLNLKTLTILHVVRIPVEFILYGLFLEKAIPELMTFSGRNFDILAGVTAPFIYYFGFVKGVLSKKFIRAWNFLCLALLLNIIFNAILSAPLPFQQFAFEQPNIAILYFPFIWLPAVVVPIVIFSHFAAIKKLGKKTLT